MKRKTTPEISRSTIRTEIRTLKLEIAVLRDFGYGSIHDIRLNLNRLRLDVRDYKDDMTQTLKIRKAS